MPTTNVGKPPNVRKINTTEITPWMLSILSQFGIRTVAVTPVIIATMSKVKMMATPCQTLYLKLGEKEFPIILPMKNMAIKPTKRGNHKTSKNASVSAKEKNKM